MRPFCFHAHRAFYPLGKAAADRRRKGAGSTAATVFALAVAGESYELGRSGAFLGRFSFVWAHPAVLGAFCLDSWGAVLPGISSSIVPIRPRSSLPVSVRTLPALWSVAVRSLGCVRDELL